MDEKLTEVREFEWKLHNFTKELLSAEKSVFTDDFQIFLDNKETKWYFGTRISSRNLGFYLHNSAIDDCKINCEVFVHGLKSEKGYYDYFKKLSSDYKSSKGYGLGIKKFIKIEEICNDGRKYLKNDSLTLRIKVQLTKMKVSEIEPNPYRTICKENFATKAYSDFTLVCSDGVEIPVHRNILAGFSPVLKVIFGIKTEDGKNLMDIPDVDGETMTEILRFIYTQEVNNIKMLAPKLFYGAEKYKLEKLKELCAAAMIESLSVANAVDHFILAVRNDQKALLVGSAVFIKLNYDALRNRLNKLSQMHLMILLDCYSQDPGCIQVFESTL